MLRAEEANAYTWRVGLGRVALSPINLGDMSSGNSEHAMALWRPILKTFPGILPEPVIPSTQPVGPGIANPLVAPVNGFADEGIDDDASMQIADFLGNVKGAGQISFWYVAVVLMGLMVIVGPVDWLVLKKLNRQPWTWVTTSGWVLLVTTGAIFAGHLVKGGQLVYRTLRTVDQVDDHAIASTDYLAIYSPRTRVYTVGADPDAWWQPGGVSEYGGSGMKVDVDFHQTDRGNVPESMLVNIWSLRFLRGDNVASGPPLLAADLHYEPVAGRVTGTVTNLTDTPLKNIRIRGPKGIGNCMLEWVPSLAQTAPSGPPIVTEIPANATVHVETVLSPEPNNNNFEQSPIYHRYRYYREPQAVDEANIWPTAAGLNAARGLKMQERMQKESYAMIYAESVKPPSAAPLSGQKAEVEENWRFIRALVPWR